ncbi:hypothetical protein [Halopiger thermotolerans]
MDTFDFTVRYDNGLREQLETGSADLLGWIDTMSTGDQSLIGGEDTTELREYLVSLFSGLLQALLDVANGENAVVKGGNGPVYFAFEPREENAVTVSVCYSKESAQSPAAREAYEPTATVRTQPFVAEIIKTASEFVEFALEVNPDLAEESAYQGLRADIERVKTIYEV